MLYGCVQAPQLLEVSKHENHHISQLDNIIASAPSLALERISTGEQLIEYHWRLDIREVDSLLGLELSTLAEID